MTIQQCIYALEIHNTGSFSEAARNLFVAQPSLSTSIRQLEEELGIKIFERSKTASGAIGYKELLGYLHGEMSLEDAVESLKMATRRYAKRQCTWFFAKDYVNKIELEAEIDKKTFEKSVKNAKKVFQF